jgi:hypothetical protein
MIHTHVTLSVSFPVFGNNYYDQQVRVAQSASAGVQRRFRRSADARRRPIISAMKWSASTISSVF